jgi:cell division protein FtsB
MDFQSAINLLGGAALTAIGWFARTVYDDVKQLRQDHEAHRREVAKEYLPRDDFNAAIEKLSSEMREGFNRLFDRLDEKADK